METFKYLGQMLDRSDDNCPKVPPKFWEGAPSLEPARETAKDRGGGPASVSNVLSGSGEGSIDFG